MASGEIKIYGKFRSQTVEGILAETSELFDVVQQKDQETINQELYEGAGGGKVKDVEVNGESVLDEETGFANIVIQGDGDIEVASGPTGEAIINLLGISNNVVVLQ